MDERRDGQQSGYSYMIGIPVSTENMFNIGKVAETEIGECLYPVGIIDPVSGIDKKFSIPSLEKVDTSPAGRLH